MDISFLFCIVVQNWGFFQLASVSLQYVSINVGVLFVFWALPYFLVL